MKQLLSLALLAGGIALIVFGINESNSWRSDFSRISTGTATDKSIVLLMGGVVAAGIGFGGIFRRSV